MAHKHVFATVISLHHMQGAIKRFYCGEEKRLIPVPDMPYQTWRLETLSGKPLENIHVEETKPGLFKFGQSN